MFPIRGQLAIVRPVVPVTAIRYLVDDTSYPDPVYVLPRGDEVVLGGTAEDGESGLAEDRVRRDTILARCLALEPALAGCTFVRAVVGLRPGRSEVRLEAERFDDGRLVVHNYGHGGSGFTLAWGCADEVVARLAER